jgi:large subunit ribosomal protein L10
MRKEKQLLFDEIEQNVSSAQGIIVTKYAQINPELSWSFRQELQKTGANFEVVKKRIFHKVSNEQKIDIPLEQMEGHIGIIYAGKDTIETTKAVFNFSKDNNNILEVVAGYFDQTVYGPSEMETISKMPSENEIKSQIIGLLETVPSQIVTIIQNLLTSPIHCLKNKAEQS